MVIYKYALNIGISTNIFLPVEAKPLLVAEQQDRLYIWYQVDNTKHIEKITLEVYNTGSEFTKGEHQGSAIIGNCVCHVFKV